MTRNVTNLFLLLLSIFAQGVFGWAPCTKIALTTGTVRKNLSLSQLSALTPFSQEESYVEEFHFPRNNGVQSQSFPSLKLAKSAALIGVTAVAFAPLSAEAVTGVGGDTPVASALAAYIHYLSLLVGVGSLMVERLTIKPFMNKEEEMSIAYADIAWGTAGVGLLASGYFRATKYAKGWDFYSHEPIFWVKMCLFGILGAASLFPTITIIKRSVAIQTGKDLEPMSEKLANRLITLINVELLALVSIPLAATTMSRGIGYTENIPVQIIGPVVAGSITGVLLYKYIKEALTWSED